MVAVINPASAGTGVVFVRRDLPGEPQVECRLEHVVLQPRWSSLEQNGIVVHFTESKVVHLSSLVNGFNFPSVDQAGDVLKLDRDVIHSVENPNEEQAHALHLYKGDFTAISDRRSLWSWDGHQQMPFTFPDLLRESATAMHRSGNRTGLQELVEAMPASKAFVDRLADAP